MLGINFPYAARHRVIAQLDIEPAFLNHQGTVSSSIVMALADCANGYGASLNLAPGSTSVPIESKTHFLCPGRGRTLRAEASPVHLGSTISVWRAPVFRDEEQIAEVTQTQMTVAAGDVVALPQRTGAAERGTGTGQGVVAEGFSKAVVDERWRRIVEGASKVIAAKGFAKATIREIAAASDMPVATMYQYLERKEDILHNVYRILHDRDRYGADPLARQRAAAQGAACRSDPDGCRGLRPEPPLHQADVSGEPGAHARGQAPGL